MTPPGTTDVTPEPLATAPGEKDAPEHELFMKLLPPPPPPPPPPLFPPPPPKYPPPPNETEPGLAPMKACPLALPPTPPAERDPPGVWLVFGVPHKIECPPLNPIPDAFELASPAPPPPPEFVIVPEPAPPAITSAFACVRFVLEKTPENPPPPNHVPCDPPPPLEIVLVPIPATTETRVVPPAQG